MKRLQMTAIVVLFLASFGSVLAASKGKEPSKDLKFVQEASIGGMFEVEAGKIAVQKGESEEVKAFGQRMVDDHSKVNSELKQLAEGKGIKLQGKLDRKSAEQLDKLSKLSGADFDRQYIDMMIKDHKGDVKAFANEAEKGKGDDVKAFAAKTLPILREHLKLAQEAAVKVGKPGK